MKYTKQHLTFEKQVELLISRGLIVKDREAAEQALRSISYYRLSAYSLPFQTKKDKFKAKTSIEQILRLYEFDHNLRVLVFDSLEFIEIGLRSALTYHLADVYGAFGYTDPSIFSPNFNHSIWLTDIEEQLRRSRETFITHYRTRYKSSQHFPLWMATEVFSFGSLSRMFGGLHYHDKKIIAKRFGVAAPILQSWLHSLVYLRNLCAHHSRLWNRELAISPKIPNKETGWHTPFTIRNNRIFGLLTIICYCSNRLGVKYNIKKNLIKLLSKYPDVPLPPMGLETDWSQHDIWK